jgi:ribonuclease P protein component
MGFLSTNHMKVTKSLKKNKDFQQVYKKGKSFANNYFVMYVLENELEENRLGISVSKKVGKSVQRHRLTRLIRENYRCLEESLHRGLDIVVIARIGSRGIGYKEVESALIHLGKLHKIIIREV